jgi:hypothetical protein
VSTSSQRFRWFELFEPFVITCLSRSTRLRNCERTVTKAGFFVPIIFALGLLVALPRAAMSSASASEWSPPRWCDRHLIVRLLEGTDQTGSDENAFNQFVFLTDALTAMGCLPPRPTTGCIHIGALWTCGRQ